MPLPNKAPPTIDTYMISSPNKTAIQYPSFARTNRHRQNPERHGRRNQRPRTKAREDPSAQTGDDAGIVDGENTVIVETQNLASLRGQNHAGKPK